MSLNHPGDTDSNTAIPSVPSNYDAALNSFLNLERLKQEIQRLFQARPVDENDEDIELTENCLLSLSEFVRRLAHHIFDWTNEGQHPHQHPTIPSVSSITSPSYPSAATQLQHLLALANRMGVNTANLNFANYLVPSHHPHPLQLYAARYRSGTYRCNICWHKGRDLVYACDECHWDSHPSCFARVSGIDTDSLPATTPLPNPEPEYQGTRPPDAAERIELDFPEHVSRRLPWMKKASKRNRRKSIAKFEKNSAMDAFSSETIQYLLDQWNHTCSLESPNRQLKLTPIEEVTCSSMIATVVVNLLHFALQDLREEVNAGRGRSTIRPFDILWTVNSDDEYRVLSEYLNSPFPTDSTIRPIDQISSAHWSAALNPTINVPIPHPFPRLTQFESMLADTFQQNVDRLTEINGEEWYFDPVKIKSYAQQYADLQLPPGDDYFFRQHGITPITFYGGTRHGLSFDTEHSEVSERICTFSVPTYSGESYPLCLELRRRVDATVVGDLWDMKRVSTVARLCCPAGAEGIVMVFSKEWADSARENGFEGPANTQSNHEKSDVIMSPAPTSASATSSTKVQLSMDSKTPSSTSPSKVTSHAAALKPHPLLAHRTSTALARPWRNFVDRQLLYELTQRTSKEDADEVSKDLPTVQRLQTQVVIAFQLFAYEFYSTALWSANHPLSVRHFFTQELLREQSRQAGLPELPNDLLHLIGEYEPAHLPCPPSTYTAPFVMYPSASQLEQERFDQSSYKERLDFVTSRDYQVNEGMQSDEGDFDQEIDDDDDMMDEVDSDEANEVDAMNAAAEAEAYLYAEEMGDEDYPDIDWDEVDGDFLPAPDHTYPVDDDDAWL